MSIPDLAVGGVVVQVKMGSVAACSYNNCCVFVRHSSTAKSEDIVKLEASRDGKINSPRENIEISLSTPYLFDIIKDSPVLRPYNRIERFMVARRRDALIHNTLNSYYNVLACKYGPEITTIALVWQGVDFVEMYTKAAPLCIFHIQKISEGIKHVCTVQKTIDFMLRNFRERLRKSSTGVDDIKALESIKDSSLEVKYVAANSSRISKEKESYKRTGTSKSGDWRVICDDDVDSKLFEIAQRRGLGKKSTMLKITRTLNALRNEGQRPKQLIQLCSTKELDHLSKSKAEQFIRFALHLRNVYRAIAQDEGRSIPEDGEAEPPDDKSKVIAKFRKLKVPERFSDSPTARGLLRETEGDSLDSFVGQPIVSLDTRVDDAKLKDEEEGSEESTLESVTRAVEEIDLEHAKKAVAVIVDVESTEEVPLGE